MKVVRIMAKDSWNEENSKPFIYREYRVDDFGGLANTLEGAKRYYWVLKNGFDVAGIVPTSVEIAEI